MLQEMGVRLFWPEPAVPAQAQGQAPAAPAAAPRSPPAVRPVAAPVARAPDPVRVAVPAGAADASTLGWDALEQAVADWAAGLRRQPVFGTGDRQADWLCIGDPPVEDEEREGLPFAGDAGRLLDNMLAAVGAGRQRGAYLTNVLKCRLAPDRAGEAEEVAQSLAFLRRQVELLRPRVILAMGRYAVQALLQSSEPPGRLRGQVHRWHDAPVIVTFHPQLLLRVPADKSRAWADLCLARGLVDPG